MFSGILGKKKEKKSASEHTNSEIVLKVSKMNLTEMRAYVNNKLANDEITEDGLHEVMKKLITPHETTMKLYIQIDDMDQKKKKAFDLILLISKSKKITIETVELMQKFTLLCEDIIKKFDQDYKEIYESKLNDAVEHALVNLNELAELQKKMNVLGE
jgi:Ni,Fe-hydrogenase III component G